MYISPNITSEVNKLQTVIIHKPSDEVEAVTPETAQEALYGDILNISVAQKEYDEFAQLLRKTCDVITIEELFCSAFETDDSLLKFLHEYLFQVYNEIDFTNFSGMSQKDTFNEIVKGIKSQKKLLTRYLQHNQYLSSPLHNLFFTRDISFCLGNTVFISKMAKEIRKSEAYLFSLISMEYFSEKIHIEGLYRENHPFSIEGGDVLVASDEVLVIGISERTTSEAIDYLIGKLRNTPFKYIIAQQLPKKDHGSFIHLDMVFTFTDVNQCVIYKPVIYNIRLQTVFIEIEDGAISNLKSIDNILDGLKMTGLDYEPIFCGNGIKSIEEREQWHSGANFLALAPGKIIGYERNNYTNEALNNKGYEIINAREFIHSYKNMHDYNKCVFTIEGAELARGGGGPRCMTLPLNRE